MITNQGQKAVLNYFGGQSPHIADYIAVGTGTTPATASDTKLAVEAVRMPVTSIAADLANNRIVFKAQVLPGRVPGDITEVGLYNNGDLASASLVARSVLAQPKMPSTVVPTEVEYALQITWGFDTNIPVPVNGGPSFQQPGWSLSITDNAGDATGQTGPISVTFTPGSVPTPTDMGQIWLSNTDPAASAGFPNMSDTPFNMPPAPDAVYQQAFEMDATPGNRLTWVPNTSFRYIIFLTTPMGGSTYSIREVWDMEMMMP